MNKEVERQLEIIKERTEEIFPESELREKIERSVKNNKPLNIKFGIDPTGSELHIGHAVPLRKLKQLQDLGHNIFLVIGSFTAKIGDPTGKSETRKVLSDEEILKNCSSYLEQASKILDVERINCVYNGDWLSKISFADLLTILAKFTVAKMINREDFANRLSQNQPLSLVELMYPVMQAYDSVHLRADIELGGSDQKFNMLKGRELQRAFGQEPQACLVFPILEGTSGGEKMSKSLNNYISIDEDPKTIFGKVMSIPDSLMERYFRLATTIDLKEIEDKKGEMEKNPFESKKQLAYNITSLYSNEVEAEGAAKYFETLFSKREVPEEVEEFTLKGKEKLIDLVALAGKVSKSESRRLLKGGAVKIDGSKVEDGDNEIEGRGQIIKIGKKRIFRLINQ